MRPIYSQHARDRMDEYGISEAEVERALARPFRTDVIRATGYTIFFGRPKGRTIRVVVVPGSSPPFIVTVMENS